MSLFKNVCLGWGKMCMLVFYCEGRRNTSRNRHEECGVQESGIHSGVVGGLAVFGLQHKHTHRPGGAPRMNNSATVGDYSGPLLFLPFSCVTDRHAAPRLCGHPAWILQDVWLLHDMNTRTLYACYTLWKEEMLRGHVSIFLPVSVLTLVRFWGEWDW